MKNNSTQHILRLDQIYNLKTFNLKNIHSGSADYYASNKTLQYELYPMILSAWNGSRSYRTKRHSETPPTQSIPRFNNLSNPYIKGNSDLIFLKNEETNTQKIIKPNTTSLYPQTIDKNLEADFQWENLKKDLWFMKTSFFQHVAWNMKHELLTRFLNSAYFSLRPSFHMNIGEEKGQSIVLKGLLNHSGYLWKENQTDQQNTVLAFNETEQNTSKNTNFSRLEQDRLHKTNIEDSSNGFVTHQKDLPTAHTPSECYKNAFNHPHGSPLHTQKIAFLQNSGLNIYGGSWYFENLTFPYIRFSALRLPLPSHVINSSRVARQIGLDSFEKKGSLKNFQLYSETNNFTPLSFRSVKSWCFSRMGMNRRKVGFASSYIPLTISKLDSKSINGIVQKNEHAHLEFASPASKWFPQIKDWKGPFHANLNQVRKSSSLVESIWKERPRNSWQRSCDLSFTMKETIISRYQPKISASLYLNLAYNTSYFGSKINKLSYSPKTKMESQLRWKEPEGPDIGIYSLAHKLASLGLHGVGRDSNSDTDIYPFKYNDYYRYNFQNKSIKYFPTYFSYSRKFLDFKNPIFSKIYAPLFQPQGLNLLSFVSQKITPSIDPNLKNFYNPSQIIDTSTSTFNGQKSKPFAPSQASPHHAKGIRTSLGSISALRQFFPFLKRRDMEVNDKWSLKMMYGLLRKKDHNISNYSNPLLSQNIDARTPFLNTDTTIWDDGNKNWDEKILIGNHFSSESRFMKKQSCVKKPAIFFSSYRHLPYFLLSEKTSTSSVQSDFDKFNSRVENFLPVPKSPRHSYETALQYNYDDSLQPEEPYSKKDQALPDVSLQFPSFQDETKLSKQWDGTQQGEDMSAGVNRKSILKVEGDSVTAPLHKSFTIKPLSAFIKREIGYQMSRFWFKRIDALPYHNTPSLRLKWDSFHSRGNNVLQSDKMETGKNTSKKIKRNLSIPYVFPTKSDLNNDKVILQENVWTIFPPLFQHLSFRFVDLNLSRTWSSHLKTHSDSSYYKESKLHDMTDEKDSSSQSVGFRPLTQVEPVVSLQMKRWGIAQKKFFRFPLPLSFSDFFRLSLNKNNQSLIKNKQRDYAANDKVSSVSKLPSFNPQASPDISPQTKRWGEPQSEFENQNTIESNNNAYKESRVLQSEKKGTGESGFGLTQKPNWHSPNNTQNEASITEQEKYVPQKVTASNEKHSSVKNGNTIPSKNYFLFDPREGKNYSSLKNLGNNTKDSQFVNSKDRVKQEAYTNSSDHTIVFAEPIINFRRHLEQLDSKIYPLNVSRHNELNLKIGVYGEKPLLKTRTTHGPPLKNQKESISLPNYLKNITNQNYQNLCPNQLKELYFVFWILFSKTLFIYLSLHYLRKFITFLGTEYIRNLFKIFVTMKFIDGNILSIIKTFQDFNFQLNQQNVIDIKVNKQLKSVKRS